jgi:uncharacterized membrane protein
VATVDQHPTPSKAAIAGHPLHPLLVPFPIAFLVGLLITDLVNRATDNPFWAQASYWLAIAGLVTGVLAALAGFIDFASRPQIRRLSIAWVHFLGNGVAMLLTVLNILLRRPDPAAPVSTTELALSAVVTLIFLVTGWLGGEMVFRHRIGMAPAESEPARLRRDVDPGRMRAARH